MRPGSRRLSAGCGCRRVTVAKFPVCSTARGPWERRSGDLRGWRAAKCSAVRADSRLGSTLDPGVLRQCAGRFWGSRRARAGCRRGKAPGAGARGSRSGGGPGCGLPASRAGFACVWRPQTSCSFPAAGTRGPGRVGGLRARRDAGTSSPGPGPHRASSCSGGSQPAPAAPIVQVAELRGGTAPLSAQRAAVLCAEPGSSLVGNLAASSPGGPKP